MQVETEERATEERLADADRRLLEAEQRLKQAELAAFSGTPLLAEDTVPEEGPDEPMSESAGSPWAVNTADLAAKPIRVAPLPRSSANRPGERRLGGPLAWAATLVAVMGIGGVLALTSSDDGATDRVVDQTSNEAPAAPAAGAGDSRSAKPAKGSKKPSGNKGSARRRRARARRGGTAAVAAPGPAASAPAASAPAAAPRPTPVAARPAPSRPTPSQPAAPPQEPSVNIPSGGGSSPSPSGDPAGRLPSP